MRRISYLLTLFLALLATPVAAWAHDYWIMPQSFHPAAGSLLEAAFVSGYKYFEGEGTPDVSRFRLFLRTPQGQELPLAISRVASKESWVLAPMLGQGTYQLAAASTMPEYWSQTPEGMKPGGKGQCKDALKTGKFVKTVKTLVTVGQPTPPAPRIFGEMVELVPLSDPTALKPGQKLRVQVLYRGQPQKGLAVTALYQGFQPKEHSQAPVSAQIDDQGQAELLLDRASRWLVYATLEFPTPGSPEADYENHRPYLLFSALRDQVSHERRHGR